MIWLQKKVDPGAAQCLSRGQVTVSLSALLVFGDGRARRGNDLGGESGQLLDVLVHWHEVDGVETSLVDELGDDACPYLRRGADRLGSRTGARALAGLHAVGDGPDRLDDPADGGGFAAGRLCGHAHTGL